MGNNIFKYMCMIFMLNLITDAYDSQQPNPVTTLPSLNSDVKDAEHLPLDLASSLNNTRAQLLEAKNNGDVSSFTTITAKLLKMFPANLAQINENDTKAQMSLKYKNEDVESVKEVRKELIDSKSHKDAPELRSLDDFNERFHIRKVFDKFGDGDTMTYEGFERLLKTLGLQRLLSNNTEESSTIIATTEALRILKSSSREAFMSSKNNGNKDNHVCLKSRDIFSDLISPRDSNDAASQTSGAPSGEERNRLSEDALYHMCPSLLYQLTSATDQEMEEGCFLIKEDRRKEKTDVNMGQVWLFATLSIFGISLCGLAGVAMIPIMQHKFYQQLLHFLIAMAIGALCGDALLHLLPHAMTANGSRCHESLGTEFDGLDEEKNMMKGFMAGLGIIFFFFFERCLLHGGKWLKKRQLRKKIIARMFAKTYGRSSTLDEGTDKEKKNSYPYRYEEFPTEISGKDKHISPANGHLVNNRHIAKMAEGHELLTNTAQEDNDNEREDRNEGKIQELNNLNKETHSIVIREQQNNSHAHSHSHHGSPNNSTIACMVIMGDGLDNFTDGVAIGAAFAASIAGGFSTVIAVFFHELPHELGDFAVLMKAGMSVKEIIFYNLMSSGLCLLGMILGVIIGQDEGIIKWVFAVAAGLFLYIALVDMIPELTQSHSSDEDTIVQLLIHFLGLISGLGLMLLIASLEDDFQSMFAD